MDDLARARTWLNASGQLRSDLTDAERTRRVAVYAAQVAEHGRIVEFLPPAAGVAKSPAYRSRFADGDALRV